MILILPYDRAMYIIAAISGSSDRRAQYEFIRNNPNIPLSALSKAEIDFFGGEQEIKAKGGCVWAINGYSNHIKLCNQEMEVTKPVDGFSDGASELKKIIFSFIKEISDKKVSKIRRHKGIEAIVDKIQEDDHPLANLIISLYNVLKGIDLIRENRDKIRKKPKATVEKNDIINHFAYETKAGIVKSTERKIEDLGTEYYRSAAKLEEIEVDQLLAILIRKLELPSTVSI